jgi:hypothetical protein
MNSKIVNKIKSRLLDITPDYIVKKIIYKIKPEKITNQNFDFELRSYVETLFFLKTKLNLNNKELLQFFKDSISIFSEEKYIKNSYLKIRNWSLNSGFELTNILRERYRFNFNNKSAINQNDEIYNNLIENGYCKINASKLSIEFAERMNNKLINANVVREKDGLIGKLEYLIANPIQGGFRFFYNENNLPLIECLEILNELKIMESIELYLGQPILRCINAWVSFPSDVYDVSDLNLSAQAFHNDLDIPSGWVKVFIYLSDVNSSNGPHVYIPKSHKQLPSNLREDRRFNDDELEMEYSKPVELTGPAGTIIVADTIGFHKGKTLTEGMRTVIQLEFSTSMIGAETSRTEFSSNNVNDLITENNRLMHRYKKFTI